MRQLKILQCITNRESSSLELYLQEISKEDMLSPEEEVELAARIHKGDQAALERLIRSNLRFVVSVAKQYQGQGLGLIDLINEGNVGLITAAQKFDETRGFKFISYAVWWIRQSILQALADNSRLVRLPLNQIGNVSKVNRFLNRFIQQNERRPSLDEISEALDIPYEKLNNAILSAGRHVSMDAPLSDDENGTLVDLLTNQDMPEPDAKLSEESLQKDVDKVLSTLPERENKVLRMFYGIRTKQLGLEEIGARMNLSRERVRQIKERALAILRTSAMKRALQVYL